MGEDEIKNEFNAARRAADLAFEDETKEASVAYGQALSKEIRAFEKACAEAQRVKDARLAAAGYIYQDATAPEWAKRREAITEAQTRAAKRLVALREAKEGAR